MKRFTNHPEAWGSFVDVKTWPAIKRTGRLSGREVFIGSVTDPYQPAESEYMRTRRLLEELRGSDARVTIATKSDLVLRDIELIRELGACVSWSINTLDEAFRSEMDNAASIERRLEAMRVFHDAGVSTACFISPIFPGISDVIAIIERVRSQCNFIWLENLNLRGNYRKSILDWIHTRHPELDGLYHDIYLRHDISCWHELDELIRDYASLHGLPYLRSNEAMNYEDTSPIIVNYFFHEQLVKR